MRRNYPQKLTTQRQKSFESHLSSTLMRVKLVLTFVYLSKPFYCRNRDKKEAFTSAHMACLLLKTSCDCIARITLFSVFMYVQNEGQFSTRMTLIAYYSVFVLLMIFNCWINKNKNFWSAKNLLGMFPYLKQWAKLLISTEIVYRDCSQLTEFHPLLQQLQL